MQTNLEYILKESILNELGIQKVFEQINNIKIKD